METDFMKSIPCPLLWSADASSSLRQGRSSLLRETCSPNLMEILVEYWILRERGGGEETL